MGILAITPETKDRIKEVISYAVRHPIRVEKDKPVKNAGNDPNHIIQLPVSYKAVYSIEEQKGPDGKFYKLRHLSVSTITPERYPNPAAFEAILEAFDFRNTKIKNGKLFVWNETEVRAINCLELLNEEDEKSFLTGIRS